MLLWAAHSKTCAVLFFIIRNISNYNLVFSFKGTENIFHAFISSRLDCCISLFTCPNQKSSNRLQTVQNSAARLLTRSKRSDHIPPVLTFFHWLPVCARLYFKITLLALKALSGLDDLVAYESLWGLGRCKNVNASILSQIPNRTSKTELYH